MTLEAAFQELRAAKATKKIASDALKQAKAGNSALSAADDAKKQANAEYRSELEQFKGNHASLFDAVDEAKAAVDEAQLAFNEVTEVTIARGEQTSFLTPEGEVCVSIVAKPQLTPQARERNDEFESDASATGAEAARPAGLHRGRADR